ncbi:DUF4956 domain-containing protein [Nocardiopsis suaedae]|uniref:DUF4956 domain-containing protein n=1 Tax=Nocardiopsis suaedae TaxID=3018444 RepID=A0ABT4TGC9_9ACTN|nr:DUF4956 domain-containing protein [Nocardiopsis suaedae]MDA2803641.1 DUF4956 domain-containing protein [Nocardiopsis suaedae]
MNANIALALAADLAAVTVLAGAVYFRRHRRSDLLFAYTALNIGVFAVCVLLMNQRVELAVGFGLFGVLSIIRLRSGEITQREVGYYFISLALGLVNGIGAAGSPAAAALLSALLITVIAVADHPRQAARAERRVLVLDTVHRDDDALRADIERRVGRPVLAAIVNEVDYVRDVTVVDVRFRGASARADRGSGGRKAPRRQAAMAGSGR